MAGADFVETGVQFPEIYPGQLFNFVMMQFEEWGASFHIREIWDDELGRMPCLVHRNQDDASQLPKP